MSDSVKRRTLGSYLSTREERRSQNENKKEENEALGIQPKLEDDYIESKEKSIKDFRGNSSFSRDELKTIVGVCGKDEPFTSIPQCNSQDNDSSALSEVESDAPTEPASPPRPRRGRLIRADKLESTQSSREASLPAPNMYGKDSDSELSELDDLSVNKISSSIINGDSSPLRIVDKKRPHESYSVVRKKPKIPEILPRSPKAKRGVYRDAGGRTKLQIACDKGKYELAKHLIEEEGYDVNDQDNAGNTPLHEAALNGHIEIVKLLVKCGANVNIQSFDMFLDTPLIDASANGHIEVVKYLLDHGADPTMVNSKGLTAIESVEEESDLDDDDRRIVHDIKDILKRATRSYIKNEHPRLSSRSISRHSEEPERQQLNHENDFYWTDISSKVGRNKLLRASKEGRLSYVGAYLENGGRPDFKCFMESCIYGRDDIVSLFLAFGAHVNMNNKDGQTPLMVSVGRGHLSVVKLLLEAGADPQTFDKKGRSVLYYAKHSSLGLANPEEVDVIRRAILKQYGTIKDEENLQETTNSSSDLSDYKNERKENDVHRNIRKNINTQEPPEIKHNVISDQSNNEKTLRSEQNTNTAHNEHHINVKETDNFFDEKAEPAHKLSNNVRSVSPMNTSTTSPLVVKETSEERNARLKSEEEYRLKRIQQKKRKEQELLNKLAEDEKKRIQEREQLKKEEERRRQFAEKEELMKQEELRARREVEKRRKIRSNFPIGLRLVNYKEKDTYMSYGPIFYFIENDRRWVLELQISIILKDENFSENNNVEKRPIAPSFFPQVWNIFKFLFLYGGTPALLDLSKHQWSKATKIEKEEYAKFSQLELYWINLDEVSFEDTSRKDWIFKNLIEILPPSEVVHERLHRTTSVNGTKKDRDSKDMPFPYLPAKFIGRKKSQQWLHATKALW